ncbi:LysR substrate-binding domain-containing protein [Bradyrhizobium australiense]|uniref:LysR family transcriptional regulator n=1 Tax=Bradyrhizobium australiense TaxID=2721161 RepID=A0A7Y4LX42_9BRAD|nr:LysR substrate-binding domain-containing protein [Bradyrhizobium australiense]NOJ41834.1 LysR family transcriptional regulator [Bradyrhizobium australiense]
MNIIHPSEPPGASLHAIPALPALLAFERAASQLSFRRAARDLSLSPSAISHQIRGLEEQFGTKLFVRGARSVRLTADGERYFAKVSAALAALQGASRDMLQHRRDANAELWISSLPFFTSAVLIPALPEFNRRNPQLTLRIEATHQYADFNASRVDVAIRYGREHSAGLKFEPLVAVKGLPVCAPGLIRGGLRKPEDLSRQVLIHLTTQPRAWPVWLREAGLLHLKARGHLWLDNVPAMLEAAEQGFGVTLAMSPLIKARPSFGKKLVVPFAFETTHSETIYLVSRTEQARDRRIAAVRRWIAEAVGRAK